MRNYELMRAILAKIISSPCELSVRDLLIYDEFESIKQELERLKSEGLIEYNIIWSPLEVTYGKITGITTKGEEFFRNIENEQVWAIIEQTLSAANLDLSYPLLKELCEEIVKRYVMSKIPKEL